MSGEMACFSEDTDKNQFNQGIDMISFAFGFFRLLTFFIINFFKKIFQKYHHTVKLFGPG